MILVDTSVWIDHLRVGDAALGLLLTQGQVLTHPCVIGELAMGGLRQREKVLGALAGLPKAVVATDAEVIGFITSQRLFGLGIGYLDAHLLASAQLTPGTRLWTRDRRLLQAAESLALAANPTP